MNIYTCESSLEGVLSGIFAAYEYRHPHDDCKVIAGTIKNYELFAQYIPVTTNPEHALRVTKTLCTRFGYDVYTELCFALACEAPLGINISNAVYHTVVLGLSNPSLGPHILENLTNSNVHQVFSCARLVRNEIRHLYGFLRFRELKNNILLSRIHPINNVITFLTEHFDNRFSIEPYIIYDEIRDIAALHRPHQKSILISHPEFSKNALTDYSETELEYEDLWIQFFHSIAIDSRRNPALQQNNIPKRFWNDTIELKEG